MRIAGLFRLFLNARFTIVLICLLAVLLLLDVVLPQESVVGEKRFETITRDSPWAEFLLVDLGLGQMSTSPVFLSVLGLFLLNLLAVLLSRIGPTWRRISPRARSERGLQAWARLEENLSTPLPEGWSAGHAARTLRGFGYQVHRPGETTFWSVKHRTAPLGFILFHLSFLLLFVGGVLIYYTRFVGSVVLSEGQTFSGAYSDVERHPPLGSPDDLQFELQRVDFRMERGEPVHLGATFGFRQAGGSTVERHARVNHPARWGAARLLVNQAGLAPVLWLQDGQGFTLDRVAAPVRALGRSPTAVALQGEGLSVLVHPLGKGASFPSREELPQTAIRIQCMDQSVVVFDGTLRPGEAATIGERRLVLEEYRMWARVRVVSERGPVALVTGFVIGIVGLIWRLVLYRREIVVAWDDARFNLVGRAEYFSWRFREELESVRDALTRPEGNDS